MRLTNIRRMGRYVNPETGRPVNVHKGRKKGYGVDVMFWLLRGKRQFISDFEFSRSWKKEQE